MKLTLLGTGNAMVSDCYNTCFVLEENGQYFMCDGGGGNQIIGQLKKAGIDYLNIHDFFVTHKHIDHILGMVWIIRLLTSAMDSGKYQGQARIYGHQEVIDLLKQMAYGLLQESQTKYIGKQLQLIVVEDGQRVEIMGKQVTFFDIYSTKAKQFGFLMQLGEDEKLVCCGDEPNNPANDHYVENASWLLHEAFCLESEAEIFKPYQKHHSTVKDACQLAERLHVQNLVLYHTEEKNLASRKQLYTTEGSQYFSGSLYVPDDLEEIIL